MEKDFELIKHILQAVKEHERLDELGMSQEELGLSEIDKELFHYHTRLLTEEGLIHSEKQAYIIDDYPRYMPYALTSKGHEFLSDISNKAKWKEALVYIANVGKDITISLVAEFLKKLTLQ
ncbi:MAG: hypothetical protein BWX85_00006 [Chloroflexi bacterium ADurb.Bin120]|jgi:hypothetical protein|nr:MAG: hypothetical protein BWX85_00006 [Chloroflexi bacterium ADurb.Bin120]